MGEIKEIFSVLPLEYEDVKEWCLFKHYAHRMPQVSYAYGLYRNRILEAICTFGMPASPTLVRGAMGGAYMDNFLELNRLCANDGLPRNALSFFVGQCLKALPKPMVVVSYADSGHNHHGYIYQATNWIYTGMTKERTDIFVGEGKHQRHCEGKDRSIRQARSAKYRYFQFLGDRRQKRDMMAHLQYPVVEDYPKGDNVRYDASYKPMYQGLLF